MKKLIKEYLNKLPVVADEIIAREKCIHKSCNVVVTENLDGTKNIKIY